MAFFHRFRATSDGGRAQPWLWPRAAGICRQPFVPWRWWLSQSKRVWNWLGR